LFIDKANSGNVVLVDASKSGTKIKDDNYDEWALILNRPPMAVKIESVHQSLLNTMQSNDNMHITNRSPMATDLAVNENLPLWAALQNRQL
jgi:hypothetical protein